MPLLHSDAEIAKESKDALGILSLSELPAQVEQEISFFARYCRRLAEQFVDDLLRATQPALKRAAVGKARGSAGRGTQMRFKASGNSLTSRVSSRATRGA